ncbi:DUF5696 domain-containing protein [Paenibacillus soyae]|uniref:DUF5696 domain-containing protein n=1 Tax=Paenibacillus soyae TaxID=2969249 RepID=A0A9X2SAZ0_9BACL|nr:DUF5696 domain-containing protein [Paenibacillus soyae]MCR2804232.1 DUF5696 domain-containing protein [Paenibacillus soyae]
MLKNINLASVVRIKAIGRRELALAVLAVLIVAALSFLPSVIKHYGIARQPLPEYNREGVSAQTGKLDPKAGTVLLSSSEGKELYLDTGTLNLKVVDTSSGAVWNSLFDDGKSGDVEKSPIVIRFLGEDSAMHEWDAYRYAIQNGRYTLNRIENGVQIVFDFFETESYRLEEYMPAKISIESYETLFLKKLEELAAQGNLTAAQVKKYEEALSIAYQRDEDNGLYFFKFSGLPPLSLVKDLIQFSKDVGYTTDMLIADSQQFGVTVTITQPARFVVTMEATLDKGDLVVKVPTYEIVGDNDFYTIQNIAVLPSFGLASAEKVDDGQIVVPDGAGALFQVNTFNGKFPEYERPVYDNTYYNTLYEMPEFPENLTMPVFGMYATDLAGRSQGHLGIIEKGAELGYVKVQLGTKDTSAGGAPYNKVYSTFDSMQYSRVKVFGPYSDNEARFLATTGLIHVDYTVRYKLFGEKVDYYDLAKAYRDYLIEAHGLEPAYSAEPKLFLDVIGTVTLERRLLGIPYSKPYSMTKYSQLLEIMRDLKDVSAVVSYKGVLNGGLNNTIGNKAELVGENGSKKELEALMSGFREGNDELFLHADLLRLSDTSGGFWPKSNALYGYDGKPIEFQKYNYANGWFDLGSTKRFLLNPLYLSDTVDGFLGGSAAYPNIALGDLGSTYYASYNPREIIDPVATRSIVEENLRKLSEQKMLALDNPNMDRIPHIAYASDISRESSNYATMFSSIPFRQLVMNGLAEYTTLNVNLSPDRSDYFLLQALELGSIPKFTISAENVDILKNSEYSDYYSIQYSMLADKIKAMYSEYSEGLAAIGSKEITGHRMLAAGVFETTYASGASVIVNYNKYPVAISGTNLEALGYLIKPKT